MSEIRDDQIVFENVGVIVKAEIPVLKNGGVVVLRGRNGVGKTTAINAIDKILTGNGDVHVRDDCDEGIVQGLGMCLRLGKKTRPSGRLTVSSLEGKLALEDLIDPQTKDPKLADAKRIKALIQVTGVPASVELFRSLLEPDDFKKCVSAATEKETDLVEMAAKFKRDLEEEARIAEANSAKLANGATATMKAYGDAKDPGITEAAAKEALREAINAEAFLKGQKEAIDKSYSNLETATRRLDELPSVSDEIKVVDAKIGMIDSELKDLVSKLSALKIAVDSLRIERDTLDDRLAFLIEQDQLRLQVEEIIAESRPIPITDDQVLNAAGNVLSAQSSLLAAKTYESATLALKEASAQMAQANESSKIAERLRGAAGKVDQVLTDAVQRTGSGAVVERGRLFVETSRGKTKLAELSDGERSKWAVEIGARSVGEGGVLTLDQRVWGELDPEAHQDVANLCRDLGVTLYAAQPTSDDVLNAEVL